MTTFPWTGFGASGNLGRMGEFGERVRRARELGQLTKRGLSRHCGLASNHIHLVESGKSVWIETAATIASTLGVTLDYLVRGIGRPPTAKSVRKALAERDAS